MPKQKDLSMTDKMSVYKKILVVAAMPEELSAVSSEFSRAPEGCSVEGLITGMGMTATASALSRAISANRPDLIIDVGICGAINHEIPIGAIVQVDSDTVAPFGVMRGGVFVPFINEIYNAKNNLILPYLRASAATVTLACGELPDAYDVESMEGAAVFALCAAHDIDSLQIRTVSNYMGTPRSEWRIELALDELRKAIRETIQQF